MTARVSQPSDTTVPAVLHNPLVLKPLNFVYNWGRMYSLWPLAFGLACCAIEMMATLAARFDLGRFGAELMRPSPRQADLLIVSGTVTKKMASQVIRLYNQMPEPKYVIAMGACASAGGPFKEGYSVVSGIDKFLPVDVYVPGCPPTPQALLEGFLKLQQMIKGQTVVQVPWYERHTRTEPVPVPLLGPDLIDPRQIPLIGEQVRGQRHLAAQPTPVADAPAEQPARPAAKAPRLPEWDITPTEDALSLAGQLNARFGDGTATPEKDTLVIEPSHLAEVGRFLRDAPNLGYNLLSNVTGVDYLGREPRFEVVYHLYATTRAGGPLVLKARTGHEQPELPSLVAIWPSADLQEREVFDLFGIRFAGHPNLKRILLWDGFHGHPLRKDWQEPYYEEATKPFNSRWPNGHHRLADSRTPYNQNVAYPANYPDGQAWIPEEWCPADENLAVIDYQDLPHFGIDTERIILNVGPQHPSTHGVFRMVLTLDGETVLNAEPVVGYLHRNHEKIGERNSWMMNMPYTDRLDYLNAMGNNLGYAIAVEKLTGTPVPERAEYLRVIMAELNRVFSHMSFAGFLTNEMGSAFTPFLYAFKEREIILDLFEEASGSRMMCNYMRFGGVAADVSEDWLERARFLVHERLPRKLDEFEQLLNENEILISRLKGVSVLSPEAAVAYGITGPMLRASGVPYDVRRAEPYSIYDRFDFKVRTLNNGDLYDRYLIRIIEAREAVRILGQALAQIPSGPIQAGKKPWQTRKPAGDFLQHVWETWRDAEGKKAWQMRAPAGEVYARIEHPKGELGYYLVSNGTTNPWRYHVRSPSFINLTALGAMCKGLKVADTIVILGALDIVLGEVDR